MRYVYSVCRAHASNTQGLVSLWPPRKCARRPRKYAFSSRNARSAHPNTSIGAGAEEGRPGVTLLIFRADGLHVGEPGGCGSIDANDRFTNVDGARSVFTDIGGALSIFTDVDGCGRAIASLAASSRYSTSSS